jgi:hypothetical protein
VPIEVGPDVAVELTLVAKIPLGQKLDSQRISFNFQAARFGDVVKFINDAKGLNVILDPALAARSRDADVTLDLRDVSVRTALRSICDAVGGVTFEVREKEDIVFVRDAR